MFDLYFAGTQHKKSTQLMIELNCNILLSWILNRKEIDLLVNLKRNNKYLGKLFIDSGAFTAHRKDIKIDVDEYIKFINDRDDVLDLYAQIDAIPGRFGEPRTRQHILDAERLSQENYIYMIDRVNSSEKLLPIFHQDESFEQLNWMLNLKIKNNLIPYIGISSSKDKAINRRFNWYYDVYNHIQHSNNPRVSAHAFGTSSINHLVQYPITSSDATSWLQTAANGGIVCKYGVIKVSDRSLQDPNNISNLIGLDIFKDYIEKEGFKLEELQQNYWMRANFNIKYLQEWAENYKYKGLTQFRTRRLF